MVFTLAHKVAPTTQAYRPLFRFTRSSCCLANLQRRASISACKRVDRAGRINGARDGCERRAQLALNDPQLLRRDAVRPHCQHRALHLESGDVFRYQAQSALVPASLLVSAGRVRKQWRRRGNARRQIESGRRAGAQGRGLPRRRSGEPARAAVPACPSRADFRAGRAAAR